MRILVCGATGFIGRYVCAALTAAGHDVLPGVRCPSAAGEIAIDFERDVDVAAWLPRLAGVDAVVNAVGAIGASELDRIQRAAPIALFDACAKQGVQRVVQISALGAEQPEPVTAFLRTKRDADLHLMRLPLGWSVLRPSLVAGAEGASSRVFRMLASLPVVPLPGDGRQQVQPVSVDDVAAAVVALLAPGAPRCVVVDAVGPERLAYRDMLARYRTQMRLPPARWLPVPRMLMALLVRVSAPISRGLFSVDTLRMLERGSVADVTGLTQLLGRQPRPFTHALRKVPAAALLGEALWSWGEPLLRVALAGVWLITAWVSVAVHPVSDSLGMLARVGLSGAFAYAALWSASALDAVLGILTLVRPSRALWIAQIVLVATYSALIAWRLPEMWTHPFGPLLKNLPILAILVLLWAATARKV